MVPVVATSTSVSPERPTPQREPEISPSTLSTAVPPKFSPYTAHALFPSASTSPPIVMVMGCSLPVSVLAKLMPNASDLPELFSSGLSSPFALISPLTVISPSTAPDNSIPTALCSLDVTAISPFICASIWLVSVSFVPLSFIPNPTTLDLSDSSDTVIPLPTVRSVSMLLPPIQIPISPEDLTSPPTVMLVFPPLLFPSIPSCEPLTSPSMVMCTSPPLFVDEFTPASSPLTFPPTVMCVSPSLLSPNIPYCEPLTSPSMAMCISPPLLLHLAAASPPLTSPPMVM